MTSLVVMTTTAAIWLLPAAGDVINGADQVRNTTSADDVFTEAPRNSSVKHLTYRVSWLILSDIIHRITWYSLACSDLKLDIFLIECTGCSVKRLLCNGNVGYSLYTVRESYSSFYPRSVWTGKFDKVTYEKFTIPNIHCVSKKFPF